MSTISAVGGASSAWADYGSSRANAMKEKMFAKVDQDGSGGVDKTELQGMLDEIGQKSGTSLGSADDLLGKMDSDGNGSLSQDELDSGMKSLMPAPSSTLDFAQQHSGGGMPPPPASGGGGDNSASATSSSSSSSNTDPLDTNEDGVVSAQERAAGELKDLIKALTGAADKDSGTQVSQTDSTLVVTQFQTTLDSTTGTQTAGESSSSAEGSSSGSQDRLNLSALRDLIRNEYSKAAENYARAPALDVAA